MSAPLALCEYSIRPTMKALASMRILRLSSICLRTSEHRHAQLASFCDGFFEAAIAQETLRSQDGKPRQYTRGRIRVEPPARQYTSHSAITRRGRAARCMECCTTVSVPPRLSAPCTSSRRVVLPVSKCARALQDHRSQRRSDGEIRRTGEKKVQPRHRSHTNPNAYGVRATTLDRYTILRAGTAYGPASSAPHGKRVVIV